MSATDDEFLQQLRETFKVEAGEHLQTITNGLLELEKHPEPAAQRPLVEAVFRAAHSLKGAARAVNYTAVESSCASLEDMFAAWKRHLPASTEFDAAHRLLDGITAALAAPGATAGTRRPFATPPAVQPVRSAEIAPPAPAQAPPVVEQKSPAEETVRISVAKLDARLIEAEEMLTAKLTIGRRADDLRELGRHFEAWKSEWAAIEPDAHALRGAIDRPASGADASANAAVHPGVTQLLEFLDWNRDCLRALEGRVAALTRTAEQDRHVVGKLVDDMLADSKKLLLLPFATLAAPFPKLVRDLCREQGKEADFVIRGEKVEIDKRILEEMKDPLIHLLRNAVDHGIERPDVRIGLGKPGCAAITLSVSAVNGSKVEILLADDGTGLALEKIKASAIKQGLLSAEDARQLTDAEAALLIFKGEVTTSPLITRLSGRGLGLAIVREKAEKLGGSVAVESDPGRGTRFRIVLPSLLATFRGILIEAAGRRFVVPTVHVERVARVRDDHVRTVEGRETITVDGRVVAFVRLAQVLELPEETDSTLSAAIPVLVLGIGDDRIAFAVDAVLDEQEVLVKPLRKPLSRVRNIAGATVLGSGQVAPVLNVADLLKSARNTAGAASASRAATATAATAKRHDARTVLVAEDSITSRMLLKSILESAGYRVKTAVDGMEAFTLLRAEKFDLVVSDVEMPRLNGFDLAARIRADKKLADLPVVLVTALETREDRERGIDVGANAYIIKSRFDQSDLLDAVRRLI